MEVRWATIRPVRSRPRAGEKWQQIWSVVEIQEKNCSWENLPVLTIGYKQKMIESEIASMHRAVKLNHLARFHTKFSQGSRKAAPPQSGTARRKDSPLGQQRPESWQPGALSTTLWDCTQTSLEYMVDRASFCSSLAEKDVKKYLPRIQEMALEERIAASKMLGSQHHARRKRIDYSTPLHAHIWNKNWKLKVPKKETGVSSLQTSKQQFEKEKTHHTMQGASRSEVITAQPLLTNHCIYHYHTILLPLFPNVNQTSKLPSFIVNH